MSKITLFLAIVATTFSGLLAQPLGNAVVFSEDGYRFLLIINGVQQNEQPQTNVRLTNLPEALYSAIISFEDTRLGQIRKNMFSITGGEETTYRIKRKNNGELDLAIQSTVPLMQMMPVAPNQQVVVYHSQPLAPGAMGVGVQPTPNGANVSVNVPGFSMGMSVDETNGNVNMNMGGVVNGNISTNGMYPQGQYQGGYQEPEPGYYPPQGQYPPQQQGYYPPQGYQQQQPAYYQMPGYMGTVGCPWPMQDAQFAQAQQTVGNQDFEQNKLQIAKQIVNSNCLTSQQVKSMMTVFDFEQSKLDFAKYCYSHTFDINNYYIVNDAFDFSNSVTELNNYIAANPVRAFVPQQQVMVAPGPGYQPGYQTGAVAGRCAYPMQPNDFAMAKNTISKQSFENNKLEIAKQVFNSNCITSAQVKEIMALFSFENSRLDFAKYAYSRVLDPQNYYLINDAFQFSSSVSELNKFIGN